MSPEVVVIGGGPAGLSAAIALARHAVSTCLVERREFPIDKPCGEGLLPNAVRSLEGLGITRAALEARGRAIAGVRYRGPRGGTARAAFEGACGLGLRRVHLSALLVETARKQPSLQILTGVSAEVRQSPGGLPAVALGGDVVTPRLVVVADGLGSRAARSLGIPTTVERPKRWGIRQHVEAEPWTDDVEVFFADGCEAYVTPLDAGVNVAFLWDPKRLVVPPAGSVFETCLRLVPALERRLAGRARLGRAEAAGPFHQRPRERVRDGLVLMGDASGYVDPLTGEGVGLALLQAEILERLVVPHLLATRGGPAVRRRDLLAFVAAVDAASRPNRQLTRLLLQISRYPWMVERVIRALAADPVLFRHCLAANMGLRAMWRVPLRSLARLLVAAATPSR